MVSFIDRKVTMWYITVSSQSSSHVLPPWRLWHWAIVTFSFLSFPISSHVYYTWRHVIIFCSRVLWIHVHASCSCPILFSLKNDNEWCQMSHCLQPGDGYKLLEIGSHHFHIIHLVQCQPQSRWSGHSTQFHVIIQSLECALSWLILLRPLWCRTVLRV